MPIPKMLLDRVQSAADAGDPEPVSVLLPRVVLQLPDSLEAKAV